MPPVAAAHSHESTRRRDKRTATQYSHLYARAHSKMSNYFLIKKINKTIFFLITYFFCRVPLERVIKCFFFFSRKIKKLVVICIEAGEARQCPGVPWASEWETRCSTTPDEALCEPFNGFPDYSLQFRSITRRRITSKNIFALRRRLSPHAPRALFLLANFPLTYTQHLYARYLLYIFLLFCICSQEHCEHPYTCHCVDPKRKVTNKYTTKSKNFE